MFLVDFKNQGEFLGCLVSSKQIESIQCFIDQFSFHFYSFVSSFIKKINVMYRSFICNKYPNHPSHVAMKFILCIQKTDIILFLYKADQLIKISLKI